MVPPSSLRVPRARRYSGSRRSLLRFAYKTLTLFGWLSHTIRLQIQLLMSVLTPPLFLTKVWPLPISLATTLGISFDFSSSAYLDVSVRRVPSVKLWIHLTAIQFALYEVSPFGNPRILRLFAPPRGLSQLITSFFGSQCQGIPLVLLLA